MIWGGAQLLIEGIEELFNLLSQTLIRLEQVCFDLKRKYWRLFSLLESFSPECSPNLRLFR